MAASFQHHKDVASVERKILVSPSSKAAKFEIFFMPSGAQQKKKLLNKQEIGCAVGETISGLCMSSSKIILLTLTFTCVFILSTLPVYS